MTLVQPVVGSGNTKLGPIPNFSLPSRSSCPGASSWCLNHCYAWRFERMRPNCRRAYARNLALSGNVRQFIKAMLRRIPVDLPALRIHVSGDFYDARYCLGWLAIAKRRPQTQFWAYTRSWTIPAMMPALERLRALPNVSLFASLDPEMPDPPVGWRTAYLENDPRASGLPCPHQFSGVASCHECRYCFRAGKGNVIFRIH